jgi:ADP-ribosylglycohydrolase
MSGWLGDVRGLHARRAPGNTCLSALASGRMGSPAEPINDSKGCGGVMRIAPAGLMKANDAFVLGTELAALTHGHPSGYAAAGFLAACVATVLRGGTLEEGLELASGRLRECDGGAETLAAVDGARALARAGGAPSPERVESLGAGWVAEEALAISVYCTLVAPDLRSALLLAVNHSGDSDSTGAITGHLRGVMDGEAVIPSEWLAGLELREVVEAVADDLLEAFHGAGVGDEYVEPDERVAAFLRRYPGS